MVNPSVCQKHSLFVRFVFKEKIHPCAKNIRAIRVQRKYSIRVPKIFVTFERFVFKERIRVHLQSVFTCNLWENKIIIRVQKKQSTQVPHTNAEPRRTSFILSGMSGDYLSHLPTRPLPLLLYITSQPSCHSQYTYHEASC